MVKGACTVKGGTHGGEGYLCGGGHVWWWGSCLAGGHACMAGEMATAVDGTHS